MYSNMENLTTEYEQKINKLSEQNRNLDAQIQQLKALLEDKDFNPSLYTSVTSTIWGKSKSATYENLVNWGKSKNTTYEIF